MSDSGTPPPPPPPPPPPSDDSGSGAGSYPGMQSMPTSPTSPPPSVTQPATIALAVKLMYVGAALTLLGAVTTIFMRDTIRDSVIKSATKPMTSSEIDTAVGVAVGVTFFVGLIGVGLWLWMASANGKGRRWARIVATVFFAFSLLNAVGGVIGKTPPLNLVIALATVLVGAYVIYLLYRPDSTRYYEAQSAPKY